MKAIIQRVSNAKVIVNDQLISEINKGLCVLIGICNEDTEEDLKFITKRILNTRLFEENGKRWMKSVKDLNYEILCVSQFTLYCKLNKGAKPDFHHAMSGEKAKDMYNNLLTQLGNDYDPLKIKDGVFGALMNVQIFNDGPVTITIESPQKVKNVNTEKE
ncbi:hypothetical protein PVAND_003131 [Polypedilum vanderplanki]|uniref:D-aminoacyl-tRNA deacylase n=1 Tax=Polypedilum vanderplanki TaxID=319348 RepID=A0A9J6BUT7_POLVA|nr:hypothetical protein PVAND_003131 [Polypedilum vanderplanki]